MANECRYHGTMMMNGVIMQGCVPSCDGRKDTPPEEYRPCAWGGICKKGDEPAPEAAYEPGYWQRHLFGVDGLPL